MRKIRFRVWDKENEMMIYQNKNICFHIADEFVGVDNDETGDYQEYNFSWMGSLNTELMEFVGLVDKNKKEIFEGDIVKFPLFNLGIISEYLAGIVFFEEGKFKIKVIDNGNYNIDRTKIEVIGNIYQDEKLLGGNNGTNK